MLFTINHTYIPKPKTFNALNYFVQNNISKNIYSDNGLLYNNYIENHRHFKKNLNFVKKDNIINLKKVWVICKNQPRWHFRTFNAELDNCNLKNKNFKSKKIKRFDPDYILKLYERKN